MKKSLSRHIENILNRPVTKPISTKVSRNASANEIWEMVRPQYKIHQARVHSFTYHSLHNLRTFRQTHLDLKERIKLFESDKTKRNLRRVESLSRVQSDHVDQYLIPFTRNLLTNLGILSRTAG
jgi:hypothetical protein